MQGRGPAAYLCYVVIRNQSLGLVVVLRRALFLRLPPIILSRLFQDHQQVTLGQGDFVFALGDIVVDGAVDAQEYHGGS